MISSIGAANIDAEAKKVMVEFANEVASVKAELSEVSAKLNKLTAKAAKAAPTNTASTANPDATTA